MLILCLQSDCALKAINCQTVEYKLWLQGAGEKRFQSRAQHPLFLVECLSCFVNFCAVVWAEGAQSRKQSILVSQLLSRDGAVSQTTATAAGRACEWLDRIGVERNVQEGSTSRAGTN